ncbi:MAG: hypothetical protein ACXW18_04620 [Pyrinomonadaceae bacterium]
MNIPVRNAKKIARVLYVVLTFSMFAALLFETSFSRDTEAQNHETQRIVEKTSLKNEPLKIEELRVKTKTVSLGQPFLAGDDWLQGMTFRLKNSSGKTLRRAELELEFPEIKLGGATFFLTLHYGQIPDLPDPDSVEMPLVQPNQTIELKFDDSTYAALRQRVFANQEPATKARVEISTTYFADGTAWRHGFWHRRDPNNPRKWLVTDQPSEQNANQEQSRVRILRNHAASKPQPHLAGLSVPAVEQCNATYWGFENVNCNYKRPTGLHRTAGLLWTNNSGRITERCAASKCDRQ